MNRLAVRRRVAAGRVISLRADDNHGLVSIVSGVVKLVRGLTDGRQQIVALHFAGDFIGDPFGIGNPATAEAATDVELCCLSQSHFEAILADHPQMQNQLIRHTLAELQSARDWMVLLGRKTAEEKVASLFLLLAEREQGAHCAAFPRGSVRITLPISRTDIADFLGLTIETVSRQVKRLKDLKLLEFEGQRSVVVPDVTALRRQTERDMG